MTPSVVAVFNELSLPQSPLSDIEASSMIEGLSETLLSVRRVRSDVALDASVVLANHQIAGGGQTFSVFAFSRHGRTREQWRLIQRALARAPYFRDPPPTAADSLLEVYAHDGVPAVGLGRAARHGQVALSLATAPVWDNDEVHLVRQWIEETNGESVERTEDTSTRHAARPGHVAVLVDYIREMSLPYDFSGHDLWKQRGELFPGLAFLPRVENDFAALPAGSPDLKQVRIRLRQLAQAARNWHDNGGAAPEWLSHVTPEGARRQKLCEFSDFDGTVRCFDLHARYTPEPGRIHMRLNQATIAPYVTIAYIGHKLK